MEEAHVQGICFLISLSLSQNELHLKKFWSPNWVATDHYLSLIQKLVVFVLSF